MKKINAINCSLCDPESPHYYRFDPTGTSITAYPDINLIHAHMGIPSWQKELGIEESDWLKDAVLNKIYKVYPNKKFFSIIDFTKKGDNELFSLRSMKKFKEIGSHPQTAEVVHINTTRWLQQISNIMMRMAKTRKKLFIVSSLDKAEKIYQNWAKKNLS